MHNHRDHRIKVDNLKILASFLQDNYDMVQKHLDMDKFCNFARDNPSDVIEQFPAAIEDCGTTLCLAGWSAVIPEFKNTAEAVDCYPRLIDALFSSRNWVFSYLFGSEWRDELDEGIKRIRTLIRSVENDDMDFLHYLSEYAEEIAATHGEDEDEWEYTVEHVCGVDTREEAKEYFPVYSTPEWFLEDVA